MATRRRWVQRRVQAMALATLVATSVALAAPNARIAVVHDDWYRSGGQRHQDTMIGTVLREAQSLLPSLAFTTLYLDLNPTTPHRLRELLFNSTGAWAAVVALGRCRVQGAVKRMVQECGREGHHPPVLHVSWEKCRAVHQPQHNTVVLADYSVDERFICLTWLLRVWLTGILYPSCHLRARLRRGCPPPSHTFQVDEAMPQCARSHRAMNQQYLQQLQGRTLTVATIHRPPFTFIRRGEDGSVDAANASGMDIDILNILQSSLGFTYRLVYSYDGNWGSKLPNGTWNGLVGMVQREEADLGVAPLTITLAREEVIDFTYPYFYDSSAILIPAPGPIKKVTAFLDPFTSEVWLGILVSFLVLGPTMYLLNQVGGNPEYLYPHNQVQPPRTTTVCGYYWMLSTALFQQGVVYPMTSASRVVFGAWITAVIALSCAYTGVLISFLTVPRVKEVISSLHGLALQNDLKWTFRRSSALESLFLGEGAEGTYREIGAPFESDDSDLVSTDHEGVMKVLLGSHAFLKEKSYLDFAILEEQRRTEQCSLALVKDTFFPASFGWIFQQGNPLRLLFSQEFIRLEESGFLDRWREKYWPIRNRCTRDPVSSTKPLDFQDFGGPLTILSVGYVLSILLVLVERLWKNARKKKSPEEKKIPAGKKAAAKKAILAELTKKYGLPGVEVKRSSKGKDASGRGSAS